MNTYCIYMHKNKINGKIYVGMTKDIEARWSNKGIYYKPQKNKNERPFWNAICKYSWDNFEHIVIEENLSREEACEKEIYYISKYKSTERGIGYNVAIGGNGGLIYKEHPKGMLGKKHTQEKKDKQRELMKKLNEEGKCGTNWKNGHPRGMLGKKHSEEYKERLRSIPPHKHPSAKKVNLIYPNGDIKQYGCLKYLCEDLKIGQSLAIRIIKSNKPYELSKSISNNKDNLLKIEGCKIEYVVNTEVN